MGEKVNKDGKQCYKHMASVTMVRGRRGLEGERTRAEGRLRTVCVREEREYLSLSSWRWRGGEGKGGDEEEEAKRDGSDR